MKDIEDLFDDEEETTAFNLKNGNQDSLIGLSTSNSKLGVIELSRREDAVIALSVILKPLTNRTKAIRTNAMIKTLSLIDLSDPQWRVLVLWTKDPNGLCDQLLHVDDETGFRLIDSWPVIYVVITINGQCGILEPRLPTKSLEDTLKGLDRLSEALRCKYGGSMKPSKYMYLKVGDPLVQFRTADGSLMNNWDDLEIVYQHISKLGFRRVHYGHLDTRKKWASAIDMAKEEANIDLIPFKWTDDDIPMRNAVDQIAAMSSKYNIKLVTCADLETRIGYKPIDSKSIGRGICVNSGSLNRLLRHVGEEPLTIKKSSKPSGGRTCGCQDTADIGSKAYRWGTNDREKCHSCVYCFVRATNKTPTNNKRKK